MVNIQVRSREEYLKAAGEREGDLRELDELIRRSAPHLKPSLHGGMSGMWLAYGMQPYQTKSMKQPSEWPVVALANQKNYISLYVMAVEDGQYITEKYAATLGKVNVGKSCIRFKRLADIDRGGVAALLGVIDDQFQKTGSLYTP